MRRIDRFYNRIVGTALVALIAAIACRDWREGIVTAAAVVGVFLARELRGIGT